MNANFNIFAQAPNTIPAEATGVRPAVLRLMHRLQSEEEGQTLVEYGLLLSLIALAVVAATVVLGKSISNFYGRAGNQIPPPP